jgi:hypothetical protein
MALSDIPEFVKAATGDLIRAADWNQIQKLIRSSIRNHRHTRLSGSTSDDSSVTDTAVQIGTNEIADGAVTSVKLAGGSVDNSKLTTGAVTRNNIANGAVGTDQLLNNSVTSVKLLFSQVNTGSVTLTPGATVEAQVQVGASSTKSTVYFPLLVITGSTGSGLPVVDAQIAYRQQVGSTSNDVFIRLRNQGGATATVIWQVLTFAA